MLLLFPIQTSSSSINPSFSSRNSFNGNIKEGLHLYSVFTNGTNITQDFLSFCVFSTASSINQKYHDDVGSKISRRRGMNLLKE